MYLRTLHHAVLDERNIVGTCLALTLWTLDSIPLESSVTFLFKSSLDHRAQADDLDRRSGSQTLTSLGETQGEGCLPVMIQIGENEEEYDVCADLPGLIPEDISVLLVDNTLILQGERKRSSHGPREQVHVAEARYGPFRRSIPFPVRVDPDRVSAVFENGVLTVRLGKTNQTVEFVRKIPVRLV